MGIRHCPISGQPCYALNLQRCETRHFIGFFTQDFVVVIQQKSPDGQRACSLQLAPVHNLVYPTCKDNTEKAQIIGGTNKYSKSRMHNCCTFQPLGMTSLPRARHENLQFHLNSTRERTSRRYVAKLNERIYPYHFF